jgi:antirestriction protein ArdC
MRKDIYQTITDQIVAELEKGVRPWHQPWSASHMDGRVVLPLRHNGVAYRGINVIALWMTAIAKGYHAPIWMTFKQAIDLGGGVRKGEKGSLTVFADKITRTDVNSATGEESPVEIHYTKGYKVFNVEQIDGLPAHYYGKPAPRLDPLPRIEHAEVFFAATGADIRHGGDRACYATGTDHIQMPPFEAFRDAESYYATLGHECIHWTKHVSRLDRNFGQKRWGDQAYAAEELVAELGAAFLCAGLDLGPQLRAGHAYYIHNWLKVLKSDKRAIFSAASHAQRAADFLHALQAKRDLGTAA